jgi:hypothetical protein
MAKGVKNKKIEATEAQVVLDNVKDMELTKVVSEIGNLQVSLQGTLAHLTATITNKIQQVEQLDTAIGLKEQRLQELHGIEKEAVSLDEMKAQKEEEARKWEKERDERNAQWDEEEEERAKIWQRTEEDFKYTTEQAHKKVQDDFESQLSKRNREELLRAEQLQRSWTERENGLKAKEQEFTDLKAQVVGFDQRLKSEVAKAEAVLGNVLKKQYEHEAALLRKDAESEKNLSAAQDLCYERSDGESGEADPRSTGTTCRSKVRCQGSGNASSPECIWKTSGGRTTKCGQHKKRQRSFQDEVTRKPRLDKCLGFFVYFEHETPRSTSLVYRRHCCIRQ